MILPQLGTGVVYWPALDPLIESGAERPDVIEIEPQGYWFHRANSLAPYAVNPVALERIRELRQPKIIHGVGFPVGGSRRPDPHHINPLIETIETLEAAWVSEHLSFNQVGPGARPYNAGFLLPPIQTLEGVAEAVKSIHSVSSQLPVPFAVETAVNYLQPRNGEMSDGQFTAAVVEKADCGILLDLHNLWTNERNGRQSVADFIAELPLERVWEIHLGGGIEYRGYWLDSHSGPVPSEVMAITAEIIPRLPSLGALIYEILPQFVPLVGIETVRAQLKGLRGLWQARGSEVVPASVPQTVHTINAEMPSPQAWEDTLGALVVGGETATDSLLAADLAADSGVEVLRDLARTFRAGAVVANLKLSTRLLTLHGGELFYRKLLNEFWSTAPPQLFGSEEARAFAAYLAMRQLDVPWLEEVLAFELALIDMAISGKSVVVPFGCDPMPLLEALGERRMPEQLETGRFELELTPDSAVQASSGVFIGN